MYIACMQELAHIKNRLDISQLSILVYWHMTVRCVLTMNIT